MFTATGLTKTLVMVVSRLERRKRGETQAKGVIGRRGIDIIAGHFVRDLARSLCTTDYIHTKYASIRFEAVAEFISPHFVMTFSSNLVEQISQVEPDGCFRPRRRRTRLAAPGQNRSGRHTEINQYAPWWGANQSLSRLPRSR